MWSSPHYTNGPQPKKEIYRSSALLHRDHAQYAPWLKSKLLRTEINRVSFSHRPLHQDTIDSSMLEDDKRNLYLYAEEMGHRPQITSVIRQLANYQVRICRDHDLWASAIFWPNHRFCMIRGYGLSTTDIFEWQDADTHHTLTEHSKAMELWEECFLKPCILEFLKEFPPETEM